MASARGSENVTESGSDFFSVEPELAGVSRSGKKRLLPPEPEEPSADSLTVNLPGNQGVAGTRQSADSLENFVPGPAEAGRLNTAGSTEQSASNGLAGTQVAEGGGQLQDKEVAQSIETSESERSDMSETSEASDKLDNENPPNLGDEALDDDVIIVEASPTQFNPNKLPKTINAGDFKATVVRAQGYRTQIQKGLSNMDKRIVELEELEKEGDDSENDDFVDNLWKEVGEENVKVKNNLTGHEELTSHIRIMCGFMIETRSNLPNAVKIISEARAALDKAEENEKLIEKRVSEWQSNNKKWICGKRGKKKNKSRVIKHQTQKVAMSDG